MSLGEKIVQFILRSNVWLLGVVLLFAAALFVGIPKIEFSNDSDSFFGNSNPEMLAVEELNDTYTGVDSVLFMIVPPKGKAFAPETLERLRMMTEALWQTPYVLRVDSPTNYSHSWAEGEDLIVEPLVPEIGPISEDEANRFRDVVTNSDELRNRLVSDPPGAFGISVQMVLPEDFKRGRDEAVTLLFGLRDDWREQFPDHSIHLTGGIIGGLTLAEAAFQDATTLVPAAFVLVLALFFLFLRSVVAVVVSAVVVVVATLVTFGFAGWIGVQLTAGTAISPLAVMVLTAASCVHMTLNWIRNSDAGPEQAVQQSLTDNLGPIFVATVTTAIGFLGMRFADSPPLQEMGLIVAFGLLFGMCLVFVVLPLGLKWGGNTRGNGTILTDIRMRSFAVWVLRHRKLWLVIFPICILVSAEGIRRIGFDDSVVRYFDDRFEFRRDADAIQSQLTGTDSLNFSFKAPDGEGVFDPDFLRDVSAFSDWLQQQEGVVSVSGIGDIISRMNKSLNEDNEAFEKLGETREQNAQLMMFYELSLPVGLDINNMIDVDRIRTRVIAIVRASHSQQLRDLARASEDWLRENTPDTTAGAVGGSIAFSKVSERNNAQMLVGLGVVLVLVSAILMFTLKSLSFGIISLAPNLLPAILAFGFWGMTYRDVNLGSTVVTTMTFGIVVDDTVHFLMNYMKSRKKFPVREALQETFSTVGAAIVITSVALIAGFLVMATSGFAVNTHIGALTAIVIGFALAADLLFLPSVLLAKEGGQDDQD